MSRFALSSLLLAILATGCHDQSSQEQAFQEGQHSLKPIVAVVPVIDSTKNEYNWNLSDELTSTLYYRMVKQNQFFLEELPRVRDVTAKLKEPQNPFGNDLSWIKRAFKGEEFVVFLELVEHEEVLKQDRKNPAAPESCSADLNMSMRIRVFDLRGNEPKAILQELVHDSHFVPKQFTHLNFHQVPWGDDNFNISPLGLAHMEFTKEITDRIEDYILVASKR